MEEVFSFVLHIDVRPTSPSMLHSQCLFYLVAPMIIIYRNPCFIIVIFEHTETACESASPGCLSRAQFVSSLSGTLDPCDIAALHRIYSSFDPDGADNMQFVNFLACLVVTHKPETEAFLEGLQQTFLYNLG